MSISVLILFAVVFGLVFLFRGARIGALPAFLLAGVISGPYMLNLFQISETWAFLGDLGILFLWFTLGLGINMRRLWSMRQTIFGFGAAQVLMVAVMLFPILFGATGWSIMGCIMVAMLLAMSSTSEDMQLLIERNELNTTTGRQTFSILLFQDLLSIPLLAMMPVLSGKSFNLGATAIDIVVLSAVAILGVVIIGRFVLNPMLRWVSKTKSKEAFVLAIMLNIVVWAIGADMAGLPAGLGAFLAGMLMSETVYRHQISAEVSPYAMLFLGLFFISLGLGLKLPVLYENWYYVVGGVAGLVLIKFVAIYIVARVRHLSVPEATTIALILAQGGEFGLLMLQTMKAGGINIIPSTSQEILTAIIIISLMVTPILLFVYDWLRRSGILFCNLMTSGTPVRVAHPAVVICGFGRVGQIVAQMLTQQNISYVAIDMDVDSVMLGREHGFNVVYGNATNAVVMREIGLAPRHTRAVVIALDNASTARAAIQTVREIAPRAKIFARARNLADTKVLQSDGVYQALPETIESSFFLGSGVLSRMGVSDKNIERMLREMRADNYAAVGAPLSEK